MPDRGPANVAPTATFDAQAAGYDARTGLPPGVGDAVAQAIVRLGGVGSDDLVLEVGAGTGEIGAALVRLPLRYLGLDEAPAMLEVFRTKAAPAAPHLIVSDANAPWPVPDACARVIFASRAIHLLRPEHVAREACRVCWPGGSVMLGRVERDPESPQERLRRRRQHLLREAGLHPRQGEAGTRRVIDLCVGAGFRNLGRQIVAEWDDATSPADVLAGWETLARMGSIEVDAATHARILAGVRAWALAEYGKLDDRQVNRQRYVLDIVQLPEMPVNARV